MLPKGKLASISNVRQVKTCKSKGKNVRSAVASKIFFYQVDEVISQILFRVHFITIMEVHSSWARACKRESSRQMKSQRSSATGSPVVDQLEKCCVA